MLRGAARFARPTTCHIGRNLTVRALSARSYTTAVESSTTTQKSGSVAKKLLWFTMFGVTMYSGATYFALKNEAFYDTYTTYVPGGEQLLDALEDAMQNRQLKDYLEKTNQWKNEASVHANSAKQTALDAKETVMEWYEYGAEAFAQLTGQKEPVALPSAGGPEPVKKKKKRVVPQKAIFANVITGGDPVDIPEFPESSDPSINQLAATVQKLVASLNDAGLCGHARRLVDFATRDLKALNDNLDLIQKEQTQLHEAVNALTAKAQVVENDVNQHCSDVHAKVVSARKKANVRVADKADDLKQHFASESAALQQELREGGENELAVEREAQLAMMVEALQKQAIEIQERYVDEVQQQVETERGGRLSKVDQVMVRQADLEKLAYTDAEHLDDARRAHQLVIATDSLKKAALSGNRKAFQAELRTLLVLSAPNSPFASLSEKRRDELIQVVASSISDLTAQHGIDSLAQLVTRFDVVAREVRRASLIPEEGSIMSHVVSAMLSKLMFAKQGLVEGEDVEARLARAEYYLQHQDDLESAARELNQLKGWPKRLASDWLQAARRHLEVKQAVEILRAQATLTSMLAAE
ncbi:mitochondrial inner membrane protein-domain-containing protein [Radiomyces spectabilis]|uniref:mitochondrial inner membrane protein-domain-containing protein n=1 Tax=Radiomyces spectabilis TaxID=64574 RepID=UPI002221020B|nr:mitochondrial inner membrane protein-domain-containing protein [Radiomyces spectabilis]KAI8366823.1 mitochondrial inner membrane protein-domain-containing protein [Radiomyces spectabilis]